MIFQPTRLAGAYIINLDKQEDERGFFARAFCREEFARYGLNTNIAQCSYAFNRKRGTLRGMHFQAAPHQEAKLVTCMAGGIYDVIIDLRPESDTYCKWFGVELWSDAYQLLYVPEGFAHGYQTLQDSTLVFYQISESYHPESARGIRWNDPAFDIIWPLEVSCISPRDRSFPDFQP